MKNGTIGCIQNTPVTTTYEQKSSDSIKDDKARGKTGPTPHKCSPEDTCFAKEENLSQIEWPTKEEYQRLIDDLKAQKSETVKILKKVENDVQIHPSQQKIFVAESHPPPSTQYTRDSCFFSFSFDSWSRLFIIAILADLAASFMAS